MTACCSASKQCGLSVLASGCVAGTWLKPCRCSFDNNCCVQGPAFDADARKPQGRIFTWIDRMFTSKILTSNSAATAGPSKAVVARNALMNLLSSNPDVMEGCIDQCYAPNTAVARGYFEVSSCAAMHILRIVTFALTAIMGIVDITRAPCASWRHCMQLKKARACLLRHLHDYD